MSAANADLTNGQDPDDNDDASDDSNDNDDYSAGERAEYDSNLIDDDPDAELDAPQLDDEHFEPSYEAANSILFFTLVERLEGVANIAGRRSSGPSKVEQLKAFLPPDIMAKFKCPATTPEGYEPQSIYPLLRLLLPAKDGHRGNYNVKESKLAAAYSEAFDLPSPSREKLYKFLDPTVVSKQEGVGEFAKVLETVLAKRIGSNEKFKEEIRNDLSKGFTIGHVNDLLDELAGLQTKAKEFNERLMARGGDASSKTSVNKLLVTWVRSLNPFYRSNSPIWGLSPCEHKWLARIILGSSLRIGFGENTILDWYSPVARSLWDAHNSLKAVCNKLVNPTFVSTLRGPTTISEDHSIGLHNYMTLPAQPISFGVPFIPMCSAKTTGETTLQLMSEPHRIFDDMLDSSVQFKGAIPLRNPAFTIETKLDGERMVVHFSRDGIVKIQSRRSNWFSDLYSPVLGPPIRKAIGKHKFDIVLDGEILAYCGEKDGNQFGLNRTVAKKRRDWMESRGLADDRDICLHNDDNEYKSMNPTTLQSFTSPSFNATELDDAVSGENVWLTYVVFDVLYVNGPGASKFLYETVSQCVSPPPVPGSLIELSAMERKKILYRLIEVQNNMVEIVDTHVVRPSGELERGCEYFSYKNPLLDSETGLPASTIDSLDCCFGGYPQSRFDFAGRNKISDEELSQRRALKCDQVYRKTVDELNLEGVMFKMLAAAYILGEQSRPLRYWLKTKPDYTSGSLASDLDLVIIGAYFASGLAKAGTPSAFLVACRDSMDPGYYMPFCKVNAAVKGDSYRNFYERTGCKEYNGSSQENGNCKWFSSKTEQPDFISKRSFQRTWEQSDYEGWKAEKSTYPSIWISPENSAIVTVKAGEIIKAASFPPGVTLRHPRIEAFRNEVTGDEKDLSTIECENQLRELYIKYAESRSRTFNQNIMAEAVPQGINSNRPCLFLTESQSRATRKKTVQRARKAKRALVVASSTELSSKALEGAMFCVLPGVYKLKLSQTDCDLACEENWFGEATMVSDALDVSAFIKSHGGRVKLAPDTSTMVLGGLRSDNKVKSHILGINSARDFIAKEKPSSRNTQKSAKQHEKAKQKGVVRWTFIYSAISRWERTLPDLESATILGTRPDLLEPHVLDYLARPQESCEDELAELCQLDLSDELQLRRALDAVELFCGNESKQPALTWQEEGMKLDENDRWVLNIGGGTDESDMIIYPDMFLPDGAAALPDSDDIGTIMTATSMPPLNNVRPDSDTIMAILPLARTMGAVVSAKLCPQITHVVCDLVEVNGLDGSEYSSRKVKANDFTDSTTARTLLEQVRDVERPTDRSIKLVSPNWIRKRRREWQ